MTALLITIVWSVRSVVVDPTYFTERPIAPIVYFWRLFAMP